MEVKVDGIFALLRTILELVIASSVALSGMRFD